MKPRDLRFVSNEHRQRQRVLQERNEQLPHVDAELECPVCGCSMSLRRHVQYGLFWGCSTYAACGTKHGAHADGTPLGTPATPETKVWRVKAHQAFDPLWQSGKLTRNEAYQWLQLVMGKSVEEGHIGLFTLDECQALIQHVVDRKD